MRCRAVGAPIVRSVIDISLSIDPTKPTILRWEYWVAWDSVILPFLKRKRKEKKKSGGKEEKMVLMN